MVDALLAAGRTHAHLAMIQTITAQIDTLARQITEAVTAHPDRQIFISHPRRVAPSNGSHGRML